MTCRDLPERDHVSRYCKPSSIEDGRLAPSAFEIRKNESYLSVNWIEYLGAPDVTTGVDMVRDLLRGKGYNVKTSGGFAVIGVGGAITTTLDKTGQRLQVRHMPEPDDESHSGISGYTADDLDVATALARQARLVMSGGRR